VRATGGPQYLRPYEASSGGGESDGTPTLGVWGDAPAG
jgi:hypothetical protein